MYESGEYEGQEYYHYYGEPVNFTVGEDVTAQKIEELNRQKELEEQEKQTNAIKEQTEVQKRNI